MSKLDQNLGRIDKNWKKTKKEYQKMWQEQDNKRARLVEHDAMVQR